jgi:hypothetical protein
LGYSSDEVVNNEDDERAHHRDEHAPQIEAGYSGPAEALEESAADHPSDDPSRMFIKKPCPLLSTILLAMKPAINPRMIQPMIDMSFPLQRMRSRTSTKVAPI